MELVFDFYKDKLEKFIYSNINDRVSSKKNSLRSSKPNALAFGQKRAVLLLFRLFGNDIKVISSKNNNSKTILLGNLLLK